MGSSATSLDKRENSDRTVGTSLGTNWTIAALIGMLSGILTLQFMNPGASNSHALAPYVSGFCSKYAGTGSKNNHSVVSAPSVAPHADRLDAIEMKLNELALVIKTLAAESIDISSKLDSELAGTGRALEEMAERLHRVENHVFVSEDLVGGQ